MNSREGKDFDWHVNGLYVALGPGNEVYTDTAADTAWSCRASLLSRTNMPWSKLKELGYSIQGYVQPAAQQDAPVEHYTGGRFIRYILVPAGSTVTYGPQENTARVWINSKLVDAPDLPIVTEHMAATDTADVVTAELPATAVNLIDRASDALLRMRATNAALQATFKVGTPEWHRCESIDDEMHNALAALGQ